MEEQAKELRELMAALKPVPHMSCEVRGVGKVDAVAIDGRVLVITLDVDSDAVQVVVRCEYGTAARAKKVQMACTQGAVKRYEGNIYFTTNQLLVINGEIHEAGI